MIRRYYIVKIDTRAGIPHYKTDEGNYSKEITKAKEYTPRQADKVLREETDGLSKFWKERIIVMMVEKQEASMADQFYDS